MVSIDAPGTPGYIDGAKTGKDQVLDTLTLKNMRFFARHGLYPEERALGQRFEVDLVVKGDFSSGTRSDDPRQLVDYSRLYEAVRDVVTGESFKLVEALAEQIASSIGRSFAPIDLTLRVRKPDPPLEAHFDGIEVEIQRSYE